MNETLISFQKKLYAFFSKEQKYFSPTKNIASWIIDNAVTEKLTNYEIIIKQNLAKWYKQSVINICIVVFLVIIGLFTYVFTDKTGILKFLVAIAYLFSIGIFLFRRIQNIITVIRNRKLISAYTSLCIKGIKKYEYGNKIKSILYDVYNKLYNENISVNKSKVHKIASKLHIIPNNEEIFEIIYARFLLFYWEVISINLKKFLIFIICFSVLSIFIKNLVLLEMSFSNIFETLTYPFIYFWNIIRKIT